MSKKMEYKGFRCNNCGAQKFYYDKENNVYHCVYCDSEYVTIDNEEKVEDIQKKEENDKIENTNKTIETTSQKEDCFYYDEPATFYSMLKIVCYIIFAIVILATTMHFLIL